MAAMSARVTVAIAQARPRYLDLDATMARAEELIREAAGRGVQLLVFGETWLTGYPLWLDHCPGAALWDHPPTKQVFARLRRASVTVPGPETARLGALATVNRYAIACGSGHPWPSTLERHRARSSFCRSLALTPSRFFNQQL